MVTVNALNVDDLGFFCVKNKQHPGYIAKRAWLQQRFEEGLQIRLIHSRDGKQAGFLEYIPGEYTWRVVDAPGYLVIHCIWAKSKQFPKQGVATSLISDCVADAEQRGKAGVAVVTSDGPWMAGKEVFIRNGFEQVDETPPHYQLMARKLAPGARPVFPKNWEARLAKERKLRLLYTNQCPYIGKVVEELPQVAERHGIRLHHEQLNDPAESRKRMPSPYGVFSLMYDGRLLADHPISATRFRNILRKDLELEAVE